MEELKELKNQQPTTEQVLESAKSSLRAELTEEISRAVAEAETLQIAGLDDHDGYKAVDRNRIDLKNGRLKIQKAVKALENVGKAFITNAKSTGAELIEPIQTAEALQKSKTDAIDLLRTQEAERIERERLKKFKARTEELFAIGVQFDGLAYELGGTKATPERIETATAEEWPSIVARFTDKAEEIAEVKRAQEAEKQRLKELEEANAKKDAEIAQMRAEIEAMRQGANNEATKTEAPAVEAPIVSAPVSAPVVATPEPAKVIEKPAPITPAPEPIPTPDPSLQAPAHNPAPIKQTPLTASEKHLQDLIGDMVNSNAVHFKGGYRSAVAFMKAVVLEAIQDPTIKKRSELVAKIEAL